MFSIPFLKKKENPIHHLGSYQIRTVSLPEELDHDDILPVELRYIFSTKPELRPRIREILSQGKAIGIRTITHTPQNILDAVRVITERSQHNCILTWLPQLLRDNHLPRFTPQDFIDAKKHNQNLTEALETLRHNRLAFKKFVLIDEENVGISDEERRLMTELSEIIYPLAVDTIVHRTIIDNAHERTEIAQSIIKSMLFIGPIAHALEKYASGLGKVFAASTDDLLAEAAEIAALRGSGFSWNILAKRLYVLVPVFGLATYGAFQVEPLLEHGYIVLAGATFGFSAVALSLTTAIQSIGMYMQSIKSLRNEKKMSTVKISNFKMAIIQDFTNPARLGLLIGALLAPVMGILAATAGWMSNGWILAAVGSTESIVAGLTVILSSRINEWRFARAIQQRLPKNNRT